DFGSRRKLIKDDTRVNLLGNQLVLIAPKDSKLDSVAIGPNLDLAKLAGDGSIAVGDVRQVPVGKYAKAALHVEKRRLASSTLLMLMARDTVAIAGRAALRISTSFARGQVRQPRSPPE